MRSVVRDCAVLCVDCGLWSGHRRLRRTAKEERNKIADFIRLTAVVQKLSVLWLIKPGCLVWEESGVLFDSIWFVEEIIPCSRSSYARKTQRKF